MAGSPTWPRRESKASWPREMLSPTGPGKRDWVNVKHRETREVICGAITGTLIQPETLVAGLPVGVELRIVWRTTALRPEQRRTLVPILRPCRRPPVAHRGAPFFHRPLHHGPKVSPAHPHRAGRGGGERGYRLVRVLLLASVAVHRHRADMAPQQVAAR